MTVNTHNERVCSLQNFRKNIICICANKCLLNVNSNNNIIIILLIIVRIVVIIIRMSIIRLQSLF